MSEKLKPCPFCLSYDMRVGIDYWNEKNYRPKFWFACGPDCGARGPIADTEDEAVQYWNDRPRWDE